VKCGVLAAHISVCTSVFDLYLLSPREPKVAGEKSVAERAERGRGEISHFGLLFHPHPTHVTQSSDLFACSSRHKFCFIDNDEKSRHCSIYVLFALLLTTSLTGVSMASYNYDVSSCAAIDIVPFAAYFGALRFQEHVEKCMWQ
jgi:hypothetical protein